MEDSQALIQKQLLLQHQRQQQAKFLPNSLNPLLQNQQNDKAAMQMAYQDAWKVCHPDLDTPFSSLEDACARLLPYHVVADYEAEEDDKILDSDLAEPKLSQSQQWDDSIAAKMAEFVTTFEKQAQAFNKISRKRALGESRSEELLQLENALLVDEKEAFYKLKTEVELRERANREAQLRIASAMVQAEKGRQVTVGPLRGIVVEPQGNGHEIRAREDKVKDAEGMMNRWGNNEHRDTREPLVDFLNNEETGDQETSGQHD